VFGQIVAHSNTSHTLRTVGERRRPYLFFGLAALSLLMFSIDSTVVSVALPNMMSDLQTSLVWLGWTLTAYALTQTAVMPLAGKLSESFGRMRVFLVCVLLFTVGSLLCGLAPNIYVLIGCRVLQALGGGGFLPSAAGIVAREFPNNRDRMIGLFSSIFPLGGIIGPNLGGFIVEHWSWREVFLINVPIGIVVFVILLFQKGPAERTAERHIDLPGAALFAAAITSLLAALSLLGNDPSFIRAPAFWAMLVGAVGLLAVFAWQELRTSEPILDLRLVMRGPFLAVNAYNFVFGATVFGFFTFIPYFVVLQYGMTTVESGAILTPRSIAMTATSTIASLYIIRLGYRWPMLAGMACIVGGMLLLSQAWSQLTLGFVVIGTFPLVAAEVALGGIGMGLAAPSSSNALLALLPERAAVVTGIRGMFRSTGGILGTAFIVLALELSPDKAAGMRTIYAVLALLLLITIPLTLAIPDTARARRRSKAIASATTASPASLETPASS
jgi:EmrB/QacA subfamily drug resistance transporter